MFVCDMSADEYLPGLNHNQQLIDDPSVDTRRAPINFDTQEESRARRVRVSDSALFESSRPCAEFAGGKRSDVHPFTFKLAHMLPGARVDGS